MAKGSKKKYTKKQERQAEPIEEEYKDRGTSDEEAERRAWATVNKSSGSGKTQSTSNAEEAAGRCRDPIDEASIESFPASDAPSFTGAAASPSRRGAAENQP